MVILVYECRWVHRQSLIYDRYGNTPKGIAPPPTLSQTCLDITHFFGSILVIENFTGIRWLLVQGGSCMFMNFLWKCWMLHEPFLSSAHQTRRQSCNTQERSLFNPPGVVNHFCCHIESVETMAQTLHVSVEGCEHWWLSLLPNFPTGKK